MSPSKIPEPSIPAAVPIWGPVLVAPESVPDRQGVMSIMSKVTRDGGLVLPRLFRVLAFMGEAVIDLTHVRIGPGTSVIEVRAVMGQVRIIVPPNLRVEGEVQPILGDFSVRRAKRPPSPDAPLVRITGVAILGGVYVKVTDPDRASWRDRVKAWTSGEE
jgi:hypothetical protein